MQTLQTEANVYHISLDFAIFTAVLDAVVVLFLVLFFFAFTHVLYSLCREKGTGCIYGCTFTLTFVVAEQPMETFLM